MTVLEDFPFVFLLEIRIADRCISRHLGRLSVDISVAISVESTLVESRRIESRTRVGCYTPSVGSRSMVGRLKKNFADGSPTRIYLGRLSFDMAVDISTDIDLDP